MSFKSFVLLAISSVILSSQAVQAQCSSCGGISVQSSGVEILESRKVCIGVKVKNISCVLNYGANFQVQNRSQIDTNEYGALITLGNSSTLAINPGTVWSKVYLVDDKNGGFELTSTQNTQTIKTIGRLSNQETMLTYGQSTFDQLNSQSVKAKAEQACEKLYQQVNF